MREGRRLEKKARVRGGEVMEENKGKEMRRRQVISNLPPHRDTPTLQGRQHKDIPSGDVQACLQ